MYKCTNIIPCFFSLNSNTRGTKIKLHNLNAHELKKKKKQPNTLVEQLSYHIFKIQMQTGDHKTTCEKHKSGQDATSLHMTHN